MQLLDQQHLRWGQTCHKHSGKLQDWHNSIRAAAQYREGQAPQCRIGAGGGGGGGGSRGDGVLPVIAAAINTPG